MSDDNQPAEREGGPSKRRSRAEWFSALMRDTRISHGAFRLWHCLYDYHNPKTMQCWPGRRTIMKDLACSGDSIAPWKKQLVQTGWLRIERRGRNGHLFTLLDGSQVVLESGPVSSPESRTTPEWSRNQDHSGPKTRTKAVLKPGPEVTLPIGGREKRSKEEGRPVETNGSAVQPASSEPALRPVRSGLPAFCNWGAEEEAAARAN